MNPLILVPIAAVGALLGVAGIVYGMDQHQKRKEEQAVYRNSLDQLLDDFFEREEQLASLHILLNNKNEQVRSLSTEVVRLRNVMDELRLSA
jgi:hypothetical protein